MVISEELKYQLFRKYGKTYKAGEILFHQGDIAEEMFIIISGKIKIYIVIGSKNNPQEKTLTFLQEGDFLGEMAILNNEPRSASAMIDEEAKILVIDKDTFNAMIRNNAEFSMKILSRLSDRMRGLNQELQTLMQSDKKTRVFQTIIDVCNSKKTVVVSKNEITQLLKDKENIEESDTEMILGKMDNSKLISFSNDGIKINNITELERFKNFLRS